jgi:hypothetical protein
MRENQLETLEVEAGFVAVFLQRFPQFRRARSFREARQGPDHLRFSVVQIAELVEVKILQRRQSHTGGLL